jgi:hypothetical protein
MLLGALVVAGVGCRSRPRSPVPAEPYLAVWAGDVDRQHSDFLAIIDADPESSKYGRVLKTYPVRSRGNEPQLLNGEMRGDGRLFATGVLGNRVFVFDLRQPMDARLLRVDDGGARALWAPIEPVSLPSGGVVVTCPDRAGYRGEPLEVVGAPGGLVELDAEGRFRAERSAAHASARSLVTAPFGAAVSRRHGLVVTTNRGHGWAATTASGRVMPGIGVQVWRLRDLRPHKTVLLDAGPRGSENLGPLFPRMLRQGAVVYVNTHDGGALYASDSLHLQRPAFRLVFDFGADALPSGLAPTPDDRFLFVALPGHDRVVMLDVADPFAPRLVSSLPAGDGPSGLALSADGTRLAVANYTVAVPGYTLDGDHRVRIARLDPATGGLQLDDAFRDERTQEIGVDFNRGRWPHGDTGPARPRGLLFVAPVGEDDD